MPKFPEHTFNNAELKTEKKIIIISALHHMQIRELNVVFNSMQETSNLGLGTETLANVTAEVHYWVNLINPEFT